MNILIVDGNEKKASDSYLELGIKTQYQVYSRILKKLSNNELNITVIHPAVKENFIPHGMNLDDFSGIAWTGSLLNIYDNTPAIKRQIELAKILLNKKNFIFGSCWGLQVLVTAAGGLIRNLTSKKENKCPEGYASNVGQGICNIIKCEIEKHEFSNFFTKDDELL